MNLHITSTDLKHIEGFQSCLQQVLKFLEKETEFKPEKRFFDAAKLLEEIQGVSAQIHDLLSLPVSHVGKLQLTQQQEQEAIDEINSINEFEAKMYQVLSEKQK